MAAFQTNLEALFEAIDAEEAAEQRGVDLLLGLKHTPAELFAQIELKGRLAMLRLVVGLLGEGIRKGNCHPASAALVLGVGQNVTDCMNARGKVKPEVQNVYNLMLNKLEEFNQANEERVMKRKLAVDGLLQTVVVSCNEIIAKAFPKMADLLQIDPENHDLIMESTPASWDLAEVLIVVELKKLLDEMDKTGPKNKRPRGRPAGGAA